jgi:hypothetical protein
VRRLAALAVVAALGACSLGAGSAFVGQWRPHDQVDFDACLVDDAGRCVEHKHAVTHVPGRRFWGAIVTLPAAGAVSVAHDGERVTHVRLEPSLEVLEGDGRVAVGVRAGPTLDLEEAIAVPVTVIGHLSLSDRLSVHAGAGYSPFAQRASEVSILGARGLVGFQLAISRVQSENFIVVSLEADTMWIHFDRSYRSTAMSGHLGVFF